MGILELEMVHSGVHNLSTRFGVKIDDDPETLGEIQTSSIYADQDRSYRFNRAVRPGPHRVVVTLCGLSSGGSDGPQQEVRKAFDVVISAHKIRRVYHEWSGGIERFAQRHVCCERNDSPPR